MSAVDDAAPADAAATGGSAVQKLPPVPLEGLSLAALRAFVEEHRGRTFEVPSNAGAAASHTVTLPFEQLTTAQVVHGVIKPASALGVAGKGVPCSYAELLLAQVRYHDFYVRYRDYCGSPWGPDACSVPRRAELTCVHGRLWHAPRASSATRGPTPSATCWRR